MITVLPSLSKQSREELLSHPYLTSPIAIPTLQDNFIPSSYPKYDSLVTQLVDQLGIDVTGKIVEYWFNRTGTLDPHCDYNFTMRERYPYSTNWPHLVDRELIVSPITIAAYLLVDNVEGGDLVVSTKTWMEFDNPISVGLSDLEKHPVQRFSPVEGAVVAFKGSEHYHWIERTTRGRRTSLLINFWPKHSDINTPYTGRVTHGD